MRSRPTPRSGSSLFLRKFGLSSDVASRGELLAVRRAGCPPSKILSTGPAKSDADLEALVRAGRVDHPRGRRVGARAPRRDRKAPAKASRRRPSPESTLGHRREARHHRRPGSEEVRVRPGVGRKSSSKGERPARLPASRCLRLSGFQRVERPRRTAPRREHEPRSFARSFTFEEILHSPALRRLRWRLRRALRRRRKTAGSRIS